MWRGGHARACVEQRLTPHQHYDKSISPFPGSVGLEIISVILFYITKKVNISLIQAKKIMKLLTTNVIILWAGVALGLAASYYLICSYNVIGSYIGSVAPGAGTHVATNYVGSYILGNMRLRGLI